MYEKILVTLDGTQLSESVLEHIEEFAQANHSQVTLLTVLPEPKPVTVRGVVVVPVDEVVERARAEADQYLRGIAWRLSLHDIKSSRVILFGEPAKEIANYVRNHAVDLIAMAKHERHGLDRLLHPSVSRKVMRAVSTPMFVLKAA